MMLRKTYAYQKQLSDINFLYRQWHYDFTIYTECINSVAKHDYLNDLDVFPSYVPVAQILAKSRM